MTNIYNQQLVSSKFKEYLNALNLSRVTIYNYGSDSKSFLLWLHRRNILSFSQITVNTLNKYIDTLCANPNIRIVKRQLSSLRKFIAFLIDSSYVAPSFKKNLELSIDNGLLSLKKAQFKGELKHDIDTGKLNKPGTSYDELFAEFT